MTLKMEKQQADLQRLYNTISTTNISTSTTRALNTSRKQVLVHLVATNINPQQN
jgi:hypothetical protein